MSATPPLHLDTDRLLPADPSLRAVARRLYAAVSELPIISPHGHVPARWLADDIPFDDPTSLLITPDHYVNRLLHAHGVPLSELGVGQGALNEQQSRRALRTLGGDRGRDLRPDRRRARLAGLPASCAVPAVRDRPDRHHRRSVRRPGRAS